MPSEADWRLPSAIPMPARTWPTAMTANRAKTGVRARIVATSPGSATTVPRAMIALATLSPSTADARTTPVETCRKPATSRETTPRCGTVVVHEVVGAVGNETDMVGSSPVARSLDRR